MSDRLMSVARANRLDAPERVLWLPPSEFVDALALTPGEVIADVGAGTGYFSFRMAHAVFAGGRVYAVDVQREMLSLLKRKFGQHSTSNVELVHADAIATTLPDASMDVVFMANVGQVGQRNIGPYSWFVHGTMPETLSRRISQ